MEELKQELNWISEEQLRLENRYLDEDNEVKSEIVFKKMVDYMLLEVKIKRQIFMLEERG